jgi:hypothetical protein
MQGTEYFEGEDAKLCEYNWRQAKKSAIHYAYKTLLINKPSPNTVIYSEGEYEKLPKVTKQLVNRLLEPFMYHTVIVTATEWENFFALRCPKYDAFGDGNKVYRSWKDITQDYLDLEQNASILTRLKLNKCQAEIHMMALAEAMWDAYNESTPKELKAGEWHIPFGDKIDKSLIFHSRNDGEYTIHTKPLAGFTASAEEVDKWYNEQFIKIATARCAQVSYTVVGEDGKESSYENLIKLHDRLAKARHASPFEHIAQASDTTERSRNFLGGWKQYREIINL